MEKIVTQDVYTCNYLPSKTEGSPIYNEVEQFVKRGYLKKHENMVVLTKEQFESAIEKSIVFGIFFQAQNIRLFGEDFDKKLEIEQTEYLTQLFKCPHHIETIKCPECGKEQDATVEHTFPWPSFVHHCVQCNYIIMESEWERVEIP